MATLVELREVLEHPTKYVDVSKFPHQDISDLRIAYEPDVRSIGIPSSITGWVEAQYTGTERGHKWHPFVFEGRLYLIMEDTSNFNLHLYGKKGYEGGKKAIYEYGYELYSNIELGAKGMSLDAKMAEAIPSWLRDAKKSYWLSESFTGAHNVSSDCYGLQYVKFGKLNDRILYLSSGSFWGDCHGVRVPVYLPTDILVDISRIGNLIEPLQLIAPRNVKYQLDDKYADVEKMLKAMEEHAYGILDLAREIRRNLAAGGSKV